MRCAAQCEHAPRGDETVRGGLGRLRTGHAELAQLLDQSRAAQRQQARGVRDRAAGALQRLADEAALDERQVRAQVDALLGQPRR